MRVVTPAEAPPARETILAFTDRELQLIEMGLYRDESEGNDTLWADVKEKLNELGIDSLRNT